LFIHKKNNKLHFFLVHICVVYFRIGLVCIQTNLADNVAF
jgi:hypothetical protein